MHAYKERVRAATFAGCTEVEHGPLSTDGDLKLMAEKGSVKIRLNQRETVKAEADCSRASQAAEFLGPNR